LGCRLTIDHDAHEITLDQTDALSKFLVEEGFTPGECRETQVPAVPNTTLRAAAEGEELYDDVKHYQHVVGTLLHFSVRTRPDIINAVRELSRFMSKPSMTHWNAAEYLLRYLAKTWNWKLVIHGDVKKSFAQSIKVYVDASFASDKDAFISVTGFLLLLGGCVIRAYSRRQKHVTSSTCESELEALHDGGLELLWYKQLFMDLHLIDEDFIFTVFEDNQAAIAFGNSSWVKESSKHMAVRYHRVRELVQENFMELKYIPTNEQLADVLTKNVSLEIRIVEQLMGCQADV